MTTAAQQVQQEWESYLASRTGTYDFRCIRYAAAASRLVNLGLEEDDLVVDLGAGRCEFDHFLRTELKWKGRYIPIDGSLDGTNIEKWTPHFKPDFFVAIELLEHLSNPFRLIEEMEIHAKKGVVITTPNPLTTDVLGMDKTHKTPLYAHDFIVRGWETKITSLGWKADDSVVAAFKTL